MGYVDLCRLLEALCAEFRCVGADATLFNVLRKLVQVSLPELDEAGVLKILDLRGISELVTQGSDLLEMCDVLDVMSKDEVTEITKLKVQELSAQEGTHEFRKAYHDMKTKVHGKCSRSIANPRSRNSPLYGMILSKGTP